MISMNDLKKDALLTLSPSVRFRIDTTFDISQQKIMHYIYLSLVRNNNLRHNKFLILLKCLKNNQFTPGNFYQEWLCFCNGKICIFSITHNDLGALCLT